MYHWVQMSPLLIPNNNNGLFSDLWCCSFPSLLHHFTLPLFPLMADHTERTRCIGVDMMLRWDFCFFILSVREAEQTHGDGWVKWSRISLNNLQPWMRKMSYRMPNVSLTSTKRDMKTPKPLSWKEVKGPTCKTRAPVIMVTLAGHQESHPCTSFCVAVPGASTRKSHSLSSHGSACLLFLCRRLYRTPCLLISAVISWLCFQKKGRLLISIINRKYMLYIKCDTREMNYAVNSVCADQHKAQGTLSRVAVKICNEFQVHHFLMEGKKTSINANFPTVFSFLWILYSLQKRWISKV